MLAERHRASVIVPPRVRFTKAARPHLVALFAILLTIFSILGCDPRHHYAPIDQRGGMVPQWSTSVDGVNFIFKPVGMMARGTVFSYGPEIRNASKKTVVLLEGRLTTSGRTIEGLLPGFGDVQFRTISPGDERTVQLLWELNPPGSASKTIVLGRKITFTWRVRIGDKEHVLKFDMDRGR